MAAATSAFASPAGTGAAAFGCGSTFATCFGGLPFAVAAFGAGFGGSGFAAGAPDASGFAAWGFASGAFVTGVSARAAIFCALKRSFTIASFTCAVVLFLSS